MSERKNLSVFADSASPEPVDSVTIRFCGDSGDGMQLTGAEFTKSAALAGNDLATFPDFPAEIRAPAGTLPGVSGFQIQFGSHEVYTPGDQPEVLVCMNPAALKTNVGDLAAGGTLIVNSGAFTEQNLQKAGYAHNPLEDDSLAKFHVHAVDIQKLTQVALHGSGLGTKEISRAKNMFALGLTLWMYSRTLDRPIADLKAKFARQPELAQANIKVLEAGYHYGETTEAFAGQRVVKPAHLPPGLYRNITGNQATALGFVAAARRSGRRLFLGSYPITPASDILHELSQYKNFGVTTFQAEDEIAGVCAAIGASFGGALGVTTSSGPGIALKAEAMGLALMLELPLVVCDIQRGGPSTGLPTKTEQADLLQVLFGRNGESPVPVLAASTPGDCFETVYEAFRLAVKYMTPVVFLSDGALANGSEPWRVPDAAALKPIEVSLHPSDSAFPHPWQPYLRDPKTLARAWVTPGTAGFEHRVGGLEKDALTGNVSYDPQNHERQVKTRAAKVAGITREIPKMEVLGPTEGDVLVLGWGSTYGAITQAVRLLQQRGHAVASTHLRYLNPLPSDLPEVLACYRRVLVPELNLGQLVRLLREQTLIDCVALSKVQGKPFKVSEIVARVEELLRELPTEANTLEAVA